ncbi:hypothetical protein LZ012_13065 [Dechloromonas sp. XY25]|uniref:Uncharacterized protein n=1 Tax=Dechloromonas hankyongensis TaxID=2908002 RepID=A0ABS9K456_9RHOO|nr:hypothetical protein [Dechloromonas hankyongensis]MCG2577920.1 hypothetical protein [Dechloromonas hankyongensis]
MAHLLQRSGFKPHSGGIHASPDFPDSRHHGHPAGRRFFRPHYILNLYDNIQRLKLDVDKIAALHGLRVVTLNDLQAAIGLANYATAK